MILQSIELIQKKSKGEETFVLFVLEVAPLLTVTVFFLNNVKSEDLSSQHS